MDWISKFPALSSLDAADRRFLEAHAQPVSLAAGQPVFAPGKRPDAFLLVMQGTVRVHQFAASGREIVLYRVSDGESCIMTTACLLSDEEYLAEGVTETAVRAVALGKVHFEQLIGRSPGFRRFVFARYASRIARLMAVLEDVAFERIDRRLARALLALAHGEVVDATHQVLAVELGSAREVISRQIKEFTRRGWIEPARGQIRIVDPEALRELASQA